MSSIEVWRGAGDRVGTPIVEPLLSDTVLVERGRAEMDAHAHNVSRIELDVVFRPGVRLGQLVEVRDPLTQAWRGRVIGIRIACREADIRMILSVERPL